MKISSKARYAIMAMMEVAIHKDAKPVTLADISEEHGLSISYLEQLFANLRQNDLVKGTRGPGGGYRLAKQAEQISIAEIADAVEDKIRVKKSLSDDEYNQGSYQLINNIWDDLSLQIHDYLDKRMLSEFVNSHIHEGVANSADVKNIHHLNMPGGKNQQVA